VSSAWARSASDPWWSLGVFFLCVYVVYGIFVYGDDDGSTARQQRGAA
jgi:hypothetical protein